VYSRRLLPPMRRQIEAGHLKIVDFLATVRVRELEPSAIAQHDPEGALFFNVNGPAELERANDLAARNRL
jgi:molybdopterin-guanine dinucleotide biosynthesis protein A